MPLQFPRDNIEVSASSAQVTSSDLITISVEQTSQPSLVGAAFYETGTYGTFGKGKNKTIEFILDADDTFQIGDDIVFRLRVEDEGGLPISNATVQMEIAQQAGTWRHDRGDIHCQSNGRDGFWVHLE